MKKLYTLLTLLWCLIAAASAQAQYTQKSDLPTIYIETFDGTAITSKDVYKYCRLHYVDEQGVVTSYDSVSIRGRGNSTWNMSKKPYRIKFQNKEKFLGKGYAKAKKWTLLANAGDKTMMRNAVTSAMGEFTTLKFNPAAKFVDMVLNNTYIGTYQISDQVEVRAHRVNITEQEYPLPDTANITGGYLLEVDGFRDGNCFETTTYKAPVRIHYPDDEEIAEKQTTYIRNFVNNMFERALSASTFKDETKGYRAYVDTTSLIDWYICTEVSANIDGFYSTYFYKEKYNQRLFWGPLWDYDIAYNNDYRVSSEKGLSSSVNSLMVDIAYNGARNWVNRMWEDPWFQTAVYKRYEQLLNEGLVNYMLQKVDSLNTLLAKSQELNYQKWGISKRMYHETVLYSSYDQYVADLKEFIVNHTNYLLQAFRERKPEEPTPDFLARDYYYQIVNSNTGKAIGDKDGNVVQWTTNTTDQRQNWIIKQVGDHFQIVNSATGKALNDPTQGAATATTNLNAELNTAEIDAEDNNQLWDIIPQGTAGYYNLLNIRTQHIANLKGGSSNDNTPVLSYTNDNRNGESKNRLWYIRANGALPETDGIDTPQEPTDYALAYNSQTHVLHFGAENPEELNFTVRVFNLSGKMMGSFIASEQFSMEPMPKGVYIATWSIGGKTRSVKFNR